MCCFCCSCRKCLITICSLQLVTTLIRLAFDLLGFMWAMIIGNVLHIVFTLCGLFGALQYRPKCVIVYAIWCILWLVINIFVLLLYLKPVVPISFLAQFEAVPLLSIFVTEESWWVTGGLCGSGCIVEYYYIEAGQAGVQCLLVFIGFLVACYVIHIFYEDDDSSQPVNDELEYIKMRYKSPSARAAGYSLDGPPYSTLPPPSNYNTLNTTVNSTIDRGPDRITTLRPTTSGGTVDRRRGNGDKFDRQSVKSKPESYAPSQRDPLPWVHVTPSLTVLNPYPQTVDSDEVGPPGYYQVMEQRAEVRRTQYRRDRDSIII